GAVGQGPRHKVLGPNPAVAVRFVGASIEVHYAWIAAFDLYDPIFMPGFENGRSGPGDALNTVENDSWLHALKERAGRDRGVDGQRGQVQAPAAPVARHPAAERGGTFQSEPIGRQGSSQTGGGLRRLFGGQPVIHGELGGKLRTVAHNPPEGNGT